MALSTADIRVRKGMLTSPVLSLDPKSTSAFQTLLFLHLHTDDYASALTTLDSSDMASALVFERAYCLYRLHREKEALDVLQKTGGSGRKEKHLEAQIVRSRTLIFVSSFPELYTDHRCRSTV